MQNFKNYRETEVLTAKEVQAILKVGNKTVYRLFSSNCPFRVIKIPGGYRVHTKSFFEWLDGKLQQHQKHMIRIVNVFCNIDYSYIDISMYYILGIFYAKIFQYKNQYHNALLNTLFSYINIFSLYIRLLSFYTFFRFFFRNMKLLLDFFYNHIIFHSKFPQRRH